MIALKCPSCGATLVVEEGRDVIFCQYCGTKLMLKNCKTVHFDESAGAGFPDLDDADGAFGAQPATAQDPFSGDGQFGAFAPKPNVTVTATLLRDGAEETFMTVDEVYLTKVPFGKQTSYRIPLGTHRIGFGAHFKEDYATLEIPDRTTRYDIHVIQNLNNCEVVAKKL